MNRTKNSKIGDLSKPICPTHKPKNLSYGAWMAWVDKLHNKGIRQTQCPICTRWLFPEEI